VKTTQRLLAPKDRSMGNSVLQSGTSIGAIITPLIMSVLLTSELSSWRFAFRAVGVAGLFWIVLWFAFVRGSDLEPVAAHEESSRTRPQGFWTVVFSRRMLVILVVIALINTAWQILRAWLPKILVEGRGYSETAMLYFNSLFYIATDIGCIGAGALTLWLHRRGFGVTGARKTAFLLCSILSALSVIAAFLPKGLPLLGLILATGAGALGVFPIYHAFTQDLSPQHQGKITGLGGIAAWALSPAQKYYGRLIDQTGSFDLGFAIAGCMPLLAFLALWLFWKEEHEAVSLQHDYVQIAQKH
jgi:ACS family hexuronate transporter-like MFS transporter